MEYNLFKTGQRFSYFLLLCTDDVALVLHVCSGLQNQLDNLKAGADRLRQAESEPCKTEYYSVQERRGVGGGGEQLLKRF